jgi:putative hemolysin
VSSNRSTELTRNGLASLYCAEAGLTAARTFIAGNYGIWNPALAANCADSDCRTVIQPAWLNNTVFSHDLDADGADDFTVSIRDDEDETGTQNGAIDINDKVFIVTRCLKYPDTPKVVEELIHYKPAANPYCAQEGGANSRNNDNDCN